MSTSISTISRDGKPDESLSNTSATESYAPDGDSHSEGSWLQRAKKEITFMFTTKEGLIGDYESVF